MHKHVQLSRAFVGAWPLFRDSKRPTQIAYMLGLSSRKHTKSFGRLRRDAVIAVVIAKVGWLMDVRAVALGSVRTGSKVTLLFLLLLLTMLSGRLPTLRLYTGWMSVSIARVYVRRGCTLVVTI